MKRKNPKQLQIFENLTVEIEKARIEYQHATCRNIDFRSFCNMLLSKGLETLQHAKNPKRKD